MNPLLDQVSGVMRIPVEGDYGESVHAAVPALRARLLQHIQHCVGQRKALTLKEVARVCQLSASYIQTLLNKKKIRSFRTSSLEGHVKRKRRCVTSDALAEFLAHQEENYLSFILGT